MSHGYKYTTDNFQLEVNCSAATPTNSEFDILLKQKWEEAKKNNCFRYILDHLETKILPGKYKFVAQLNVKRAQERRKPQSMSSITMPFNPDLFHFNKVKGEEIMFFICDRKEKIAESQLYQELQEKEHEFSHCLIVNVSPLEYCNSLLVPSIKDCLPQVLTEDGLKVAVEIILLSCTHALRIGFNSLGAYASVNHFHFHVYYLFHNLYLETAKSRHLIDDCHEVLDYPAEGFVFQITDDCTKVIKSVMKLVHFLVKQSIAHNIFITRGLTLEEANQNSTTKIYKAVRIYVWARQSSFGAKNDEAFNPALCELAGHLPIKTIEAFQTITETQVTRVLQETCCKTFLHVKQNIEDIYQCSNSSIS